jgi:phospholipid transport system transporter-binding protein
MKAKPSDTAGLATLETLGNGRFKVRGPLDAATVTDLLERSEAAFRDAGNLEIDLSGVPEGDSAGLALLIEWIRLARKQNQPIQFKNLPKQIAALARISQVDELLTSKGAPAAAR